MLARSRLSQGRRAGTGIDSTSVPAVLEAPPQRSPCMPLRPWSNHPLQVTSLFSLLALASCAEVSDAELAGEDVAAELAGQELALDAPRVCQLGSMQPLQRFGATASSVEAPGLAPGFAIDNDP